MKTTKQVPREVTETDQLFCNLCGEECRTAYMPKTTNPCAMLSADIVGGYGNCFPGDGERWSFDLCEACVAAIVYFFKIPPSHVTFCWTTGAEDPPHLSESLALLRKGVAPDTQFSERESYMRAMLRVAMLRSLDVDPLARLREAVSVLPEKLRLIDVDEMQNIEALLWEPREKESLFTKVPEMGMHARRDVSTLTWTDGGPTVGTIGNDDSVLEAGLQHAATILAWENRGLRQLLSAVLETVDEKTRSKIELALKARNP